MDSRLYWIWLQQVVPIACTVMGDLLDTFDDDYENGIRKQYLLHGVTGSGKTEIYMGMLKKVDVYIRGAVKLISLVSIATVIIVSTIILIYKPIYKVTINGEKVGYCEDKATLQIKINEYMEKGEEGQENVAFVQIDDMNFIFNTINIWCHQWIPATCMVTKVHTSFHQLFHCKCWQCHIFILFCVVILAVCRQPDFSSRHKY